MKRNLPIGLGAMFVLSVCWTTMIGNDTHCLFAQANAQQMPDEPASEAPSQVPATKRILLLVAEKDHGPSGNGFHDYPLWQRRLAALLSAPTKSDRPPVSVELAWNWPSDKQFESADTIVAYCYIEWSEERIAQLKQYVNGGGGLVFIHSATWTKPGPSTDVAEVTGAGGFELYRRGPVQMKLAESQHPICKGLPSTIVLEDDETYWPPVPLAEDVTVLATSRESQGKHGSTPVADQPILWCFEKGSGRVVGCVPGHCIDTFDDPEFRVLMLRSIGWTFGTSPAQFAESFSQKK
ncbi:ThuA domain-containing protein [Bremerella sp. JC770]|uniref:ThuA domain-containing protein n=1 Tax=Bremerella sp. JC770 TaxID=3232137 RepID=UPI0034588602